MAKLTAPITPWLQLNSKPLIGTRATPGPHLLTFTSPSACLLYTSRCV
ncbi:hypothetical protein [Erwinia amylovora]